MVNTRTALGGTPPRTAGAEGPSSSLARSGGTWGVASPCPHSFNRYLQLKKTFYPFFVPKLAVSSGGNGSPELQILSFSSGLPLPLLTACTAGFGSQQSLLVGLF